MSKAPKMLWGLKAINAPAAWKTNRSAGVKVLIVTGLDRDYSEFTGGFVKRENFLVRRASDPAPYDYFDNIGPLGITYLEVFK